MGDDATGDFIPGTKRVFATVKPKKGSCLIFYQRGLLHEGADISLPSTGSNEGSDQQDAILDVSRSASTSAARHQASKIILRSDLFFHNTASIVSEDLKISHEHAESQNGSTS